jgi:hypothetical protein
MEATRPSSASLLASSERAEAREPRIAVQLLEERIHDVDAQDRSSTERSSQANA